MMFGYSDALSSWGGIPPEECHLILLQQKKAVRQGGFQALAVLEFGFRSSAALVQSSGVSQAWYQPTDSALIISAGGLSSSLDALGG